MILRNYSRSIFFNLSKEEFRILKHDHAETDLRNPGRKYGFQKLQDYVIFR